MTNIKKLTKKDYFTALSVFLEESGEIIFHSAKGDIDADSMAEFIVQQIDLLEKKNSKATATQTANAATGDAIVEWMTEGEKYTISNLIKQCPVCAEMSHPKVTSLMYALKNSGKVERIEEKRTAYFVLV